MIGPDLLAGFSGDTAEVTARIPRRGHEEAGLVVAVDPGHAGGRTFAEVHRS